jgi:hypothetical protein
MPIGIYDTRTMLQAIERMPKAKTFLRDTFFPNVETSINENIDVDFKKGKRKMAPFVAPRVGGIVMDREGYETHTYRVPKIAPDRIMTVDDITRRGMGEGIYTPRTPEQRAADLFAKDYVELDDYIIRREEWMCRELLLNGKIVMKGYIDVNNSKTVDEVVDFGFTNTTALTSTACWNTDTANIHGDLKNKRLTVLQKSGKAPTVAVMESSVVEDFIKNVTIQKYYDNTRYNLGTIQPRIIDDAVTFVTYITDLDLQIYSYDEWFVGDDGVEAPMLPTGTVILGRPGMGRRLYGGITQIEGEDFVTFEGQRIPKSWVDRKNDTKNLRISARPLPAPEDVDDWYVLTVK